jgi:hypothetical protein
VEQTANEIRVGHASPLINDILAAIGEESRPFTRHFSQNEEFFLKLEGEYVVPHLPIHHDVRLPLPEQTYMTAVKGVIERVVQLAPQVLKDLKWFFDPTEILRPCFYKIYRIEEFQYLYLLRLDLMMKPSDSTVVERGTNDTTPHYTSRKLFLENTIIPLDDVVRNDESVKGFRIRQTISQTWIGEYGRGYFQQGIWMDADLTRFFSRLFLPPAKKTYPFFPYLCKYKTICQSVIDLSPEGRKAHMPYLHRALQFLLPVMESIQASMRDASFSEDMNLYKELKSKIPASWFDAWKDLRIEAYLNEADMKEFLIEG